MNYLHIDGASISPHDICQAHLQLESDFNVGGILLERPSNNRRNASTAVQLHRMNYRANGRWVDITGNTSEMPDDDSDKEVRFIYCANVLKWDLPIDAPLAAAIENVLGPGDLEPYRERLDCATTTGHWPSLTNTQQPTAAP